jgi:hypothetical protein
MADATQAIRIGFFLLFFIYSPSVFSANITTVNQMCFYFGTHCDEQDDAIAVVGEIESGDYDQFYGAIRQIKSERINVILRSPGGSASEAMRIGQLVRHLLLTTTGPSLDHFVRENDRSFGGETPYCMESDMSLKSRSSFQGSPCQCDSACFLIYVAGAFRHKSYVGIHRPYLSPEQSAKLNLLQATELQRRIESEVASYLSQMDVPNRFIEIMRATSSRDIYVPNVVEMIDFFSGITPSMEEWIIARCNSKSDRELDREEIRILNRRDPQLYLLFVSQKNARDRCIQQVLSGERMVRMNSILSHDKR